VHGFIPEGSGRIFWVLDSHLGVSFGRLYSVSGVSAFLPVPLLVSSVRLARSRFRLSAENVSYPVRHVCCTILKSPSTWLPSYVQV
jgi:hypothetical protein